MKKNILITIGIFIILIVLGVWAYLFTYGKPANTNEIFAQFGLGGGEVAPVVNPELTKVDVAQTTNVGTRQKLKQLTTRPVAGATFTTSGIRYVEQGTGHIYDIDLQSGREKLVSGTTITQTAEAIFSKDAPYIAITSFTPSGKKTIVGTIHQEQNGDGSIEGVALPLGATEVQFGNATGTINYLLKNASGSSGYSYTIAKKTSALLFTISLRDVQVLWGEPLYVYTTPTTLQEGNLYRVVKNNLVYTAGGGIGLVGFRYDDGVVTTSLTSENEAYIALSHGGKKTLQSIPFIPEKCVRNPAKIHSVYCSTPFSINNEKFPDDWYKGAISYSDLLWSIDIESGNATGLSEFLKESGREIDVSQIGTNDAGTYIWFINKNDNTLWMFDTTL